MPAVAQIAPQKLEKRLAYLPFGILSKGYLNVRGHVRANLMQVEGPGGLTAVVIVMVTAQIHFWHLVSK